MEMNVLMIGVGVDQTPAIDEAHKLGLKVIGFDGDPEAAGASKCDHFECLNIMDPDAVEIAAKAWNKEVGVDGVIAPAVEAGPAVGRVVDSLGLIGIGEDLAKKLTDKILRRVALDELKIPQPRWAYREEKKMGLWDIYPCVVKPRDKSAAVGVRLAKNVREIGLNYDYVEEFLTGWELSVEVLVFDNGIKMIATADRNYDKKLKWEPYLLEDGCQFPSKISPAIHKKINTLVEKVIRELKLVNCAIKFDLLLKDNILYVIELAPRMGGGKLSSVMIPMATGINWWRIALKLCMGLPIENKDITGTKQFFSAQRYKFKENPKSHRDREYSVETFATTYEQAVKNAQEAINEK